MSLRTINFTGRQRLERKDVAISLRTEAGVPRFDAWLRLGDYVLPGDAAIYIEAYRQGRTMRFPFGRVSAIHPSADRTLADFGTPEGLLFRVKIVSTTDPRGLILAQIDHLRPTTQGEPDDDRIPLLPVVPSPDLAGELFRLEFDTHQVLLLINDRLPDWQELARDPLFAVLVYPAALRAILTRILRIEKHFDTHDEDDWRSCWLRFASDLPGLGEPPAEDDPLEQVRWIDAAAAAFSRKAGLLDLFAKTWLGHE